jgi:hypothetical protein
MIEVLLPTNKEAGLGHVYKKRHFFPKVFQNDFKGMLVINKNSDVTMSNDNWEAQFIYVHCDRPTTQPLFNHYYIAECNNSFFDGKVFKFIRMGEGYGTILVNINDEEILTTYTIFDKAYHIKFTTDPKLINDGVEKMDDMWVENYIREQNEINYKPQEPVSNEIIQFMRPYFLQLVFDVQDTLNKPDNVGFDLDNWIKDNIKQ